VLKFCLLFFNDNVVIVWDLASLKGMSANRTWTKTSLHNMGVRQIICKRSCQPVNDLFETHLREVISGLLEGPAFQDVSAQNWHFNLNLAVLKYHSKPFWICPLQAPGRQLDFWEAKMDADRFLRGSFADERRNQGTHLVPTSFLLANSQLENDGVV
jgi:hypothetical protein